MSKVGSWCSKMVIPKDRSDQPVPMSGIEVTWDFGELVRIIRWALSERAHCHAARPSMRVKIALGSNAKSPTTNSWHNSPCVSV